MRVVVVGAGLAGLFTASELMGAGIEDVVVVDKEHESGGVIRTVRRDGFSLEAAAGTLMLPHPHLSPILDQLGADVIRVEPSASLRYVYTRDRLVPLPSTPKALFAPIVSVGSKLRALAEPLVRASPSSEDESLDHFCRRRFGNEVGKMLAWLAASGVFAGDPERLSARSAFPTLTTLESEAGSVVRGGMRQRRSRPAGMPRPSAHIPVGGMDTLVQAGASFLGGRFRGGFDVASVIHDGSGWRVEGPETIRADHVVLAVRPQAAAALVDPDLGAALASAVNAPVVVVGFGGPPHRLPLPPGFGVLAGPDSGTASLGVLFESSYAPARAPRGQALAKVIAGGARRPELVDWDDARIIEIIRSEVAQILGTDVDPSFIEIIRHYTGIPQYEIGHGAWLAELDSLLGDRPGLHLTGWGYRGVGVALLASDAVASANRIANHRHV
ncbi:MAG: protoporphyrinogen oxidase [Acidimicrobiia bacterium]